MKRDDYIDFFYVEPEYLAIHYRLVNWANYVRPKFHPQQQAIWRLGKDNHRAWHAPEARTAINTLDGHEVEKAVSKLPPKHRDAIRWAYVWRWHPAQARKKIGVTYETLNRLVVDARVMLNNRLAKSTIDIVG